VWQPSVYHNQNHFVAQNFWARSLAFRLFVITTNRHKANCTLLTQTLTLSYPLHKHLHTKLDVLLSREFPKILLCPYCESRFSVMCANRHVLRMHQYCSVAGTTCCVGVPETAMCYTWTTLRPFYMKHRKAAVLAPVLLNISYPEIIKLIKLICVLALSQTHSFTDENINYATLIPSLTFWK